MKVGVSGLGIMGLPMAQHLDASGVDVCGWDVQAGARDRFEKSAASLEELVESSSVFLTMLPETQHVNDVVDAVIALGPRENSLFIDCSTIDVAATREIDERLQAAGYAFVDAPVSGGAEAAGSGALSFMAGGTSAAIESARPVLDVLGKKLVVFGAAGSGQAAKACHNMICGITALGVCEGFALADSLGLDLESFFQLCKGAAAQSWVLENRCPVPGPAPDAPSSHDYAPGFAANLMAKDLRVAQQAAASSGQTTAFGAEAARRFTEFAESLDGEFDFSAIYRTIRQPSDDSESA